MKIEYEKSIIEFTVEHRQRRSFEIRVKPPGTVSVVAPKGAKEAYVVKLVESKAKWIVRKLSEIKEMESRRCKRDYKDGETFMYLGADCQLQVVRDRSVAKPIVKLSQGRLRVETGLSDKEYLRAVLESWYRQKAAENIKGRVGHFSKLIGVEPNVIRIKEQKKRWGSCSSRGSLNFNWRCVMAPMEVIDYIVVHELCHLVHMNHSSEYWALVGRIMPDYQRRREWLRINGITMEL